MYKAHFDRLDIVQAYYLFGVLYHGGQGSKEYRYVSRALRAGFRAPANGLKYKHLSENGKAIYNRLRAVARASF
jgi:hypothetical protein